MKKSKKIKKDKQIKTKAKQILVKQMDLLYQRSNECDYCELEKFSNSLENLIIIALSL